MIIYKPYEERTPDRQYALALARTLPRERQRALFIRNRYSELPWGEPDIESEYTKNPFQTHGTYTNLALPPLVYDLANGIPLITERKISFWRKFIAEIIAFINGARTLAELRAYGSEKTWANFWEEWWTPEKCAQFGLAPGDGGPGGYGPAYHGYRSAGGEGFNQVLAVIEQVRNYPGLRTHMMTTWKPDLCMGTRDRPRQVVVAPCHGSLVKLTVIGNELTLTHVQRSCDLPVGAVGNIFQYPVLGMMFAQVLGLTFRRYVHYFIDGQIYENQIPWVEELVQREPRRFPTLRITDPTITDIFAFRPEHFELSDYDPHPAMNDIPVTN